MLLAIDTATNLAGLALYDQTTGRILGEEMWQSVNNHTVELMPRLVRLLEQRQIAQAGLSGLCVSLGPGSFTGLRIGLGLAKGLSLARDLPLVGIPTLDIVAQPHMTQRAPIWAILQAGRGRICVGKYVRRKGRWRRRGDYQLTTLEELCDEIEGRVLICGEIQKQDMDMLRQRLGPEAKIPTPAGSLLRPAYLAEIGWDRLGRGDVDDPRSLSPIYLQNPQIDA